MRMVHCLLLLLEHCTAGAVAMLDHTQRHAEEAAEVIDGVVAAWSSDRSQSPINQLAAV